MFNLVAVCAQFLEIFVNCRAVSFTFVNQGGSLSFFNKCIATNIS
ncbi:RAxF-45 family protein [Bacillus suaedaesalsae]